jgi:glycosyltransferase involved in cell wall biosynthesis
MPFFSPLWARCPKVIFLHHVHAEMWKMVLPGWLARIGEPVERVVAPRLYRGSRIVTLSESSREEIISMLGMSPDRVSVVPPGVEPRFTVSGARSATPLVVAVGRLVPVKRFDLLMESLVRVRARCPDLQAVIIGEGFERPALEALRRRLGAEDWIHLPGRLSDEEVVSWYRRAWVVASTSLREGWGMSLTEAGACGTPAVATRIAGHQDAVVDGSTGFLAEDMEGISHFLETLLTDDVLRQRMSRSAVERARTLTWEATARATLTALMAEATGMTGMTEPTGMTEAGEPIERSRSPRRLRGTPPPSM